MQKIVKKMLAYLLATVVTVCTVLLPAPVVVSAQENEFEVLQQKWKQILLLEADETSATNPNTQDFITSLSNEAQEYYEGIDTSANRLNVYADQIMQPASANDREASSAITITYTRLQALARAYYTPGTAVYQEEAVKTAIIESMDFMVENIYTYERCNSTATSSLNYQYGNWYDWQIGSAEKIIDIVMLLADELTTEQISTYMAPVIIVDRFDRSNVKGSTGTNRVWIMNVLIGAGILTQDSSIITQAVANLETVFKLVSSGDGFYQDGSFIQHTYFAYIGGYGRSYLRTIAPLMCIMQGSSWPIEYSSGVENNYYNLVLDAYSYFMIDGRYMDMVREREMTRSVKQDYVIGTEVMQSIMRITQVLPAQQQQKAYAMLAEWLSEPTVYDAVAITPFHNKLANDILQNYAPQNVLDGHKRFASMDRVVHTREDYTAGLSLSSKRIYNFEGTNDEGLRMWHMADGQLFLYNDDLTSYSDDYWGTVDMQRLPGTTVDRITRSEKQGVKTGNPNNFVGGTDLESNYGVVGMQFTGLDSAGTRNGVSATKSWFMFDDEIVAIGSGITSTVNGSTETIVENRKVQMDLSNTVTVDGTVMNFDGTGGYTEVTESMLEMSSVTATSGKDVRAVYTFDEQQLAAMSGQQYVAFESQIMFESVPSFFGFKLYGQGENDTDTKELVYLLTREGAMAPRLSADSTAAEAWNADAVISAGTWHTVKVILDMENNTYQYYFDGVLIDSCVANGTGTAASQSFTGGNIAFRQATSGAATFTGFNIHTGGSTSGTMYVRNVRVSTSGQDLVSEDFSSMQATDSINGLTNWQVVQNDTASGACAAIKSATYMVANTIENDDFSGLHEDVQWVHLQGNTTSGNSDIGYYFPGGGDIVGLRSTQVRQWTWVNTYYKFIDEDYRANSYVTFWFDHGTSPVDESYAYVLLPGLSAAQTQEYSESPNIQILRQDDEIHAVRHTGLNITGINFWQAGSYNGIEVDKAASVMYRRYADTLVLSVSDPTQQAGSLRVAINMPISGIENTYGDAVTVTQENGIYYLDINTSGAQGASFEFTLAVDGYDNTFESYDVGYSPDNFTPVNTAHAVVEDTATNKALQITAEAAGTLALAIDPYEDARIELDVLVQNGTGSVQFLNDSAQVVAASFTENNISAGSTTLELQQASWAKLVLVCDSETGVLRLLLNDTLLAEQAYDAQQQTVNQLVIALQAGAGVLIDNVIFKEYRYQELEAPVVSYTSRTAHSVALEWPASEAESISYEIYGDAGLLAETSDNTYCVTGLAAGSSDSYYVFAKDAFGNYSQRSNIITVSTLKNLQCIDFEDYEQGTYLGEGTVNGWVLAGTDPEGYVQILDAPGDIGQGNAMLVSTATSGVSYSATYGFADQTGEFTYSLDVYMGSVPKFGNISLKSGDNAVATMMFDASGFGYRDGASPSTTKAFYSTNVTKKWFTLSFRANPATQTWSLYLYDKATGSRLASAENLTFRSSGSTIDAIVVAAPGNGTGSIYFDNVEVPGEDFVITSIETPAVLSAALETTFAELAAPQTVQAGLANGGEIALEVIWQDDTYNAQQAGWQIVTGSVAIPQEYECAVPEESKLGIFLHAEVEAVTVDFNQYGLGVYSNTQLNGWAIAGASATGYVEILQAPATEEGNLAMMVSTGSEAGGYSAVYGFDALEAPFAYSLDFYGNQAQASISLLGDGGAVGQVNINNSVVSLVTTDGQEQTLYAELAADTWYTLTLQVNPVSSAIEASLQLGGEPIAGGQAAFLTTQAAIIGLQIAAEENADSSIYIDNVSLPKVNENVGAITITSLEAPEALSVAYGTLFEDLPLPTTVKAYITEDAYLMLPISWSDNGYNGQVAKSYTLTGAVTVPAGYVLENTAASISVTVEPLPMYTVEINQTEGGSVIADYAQAEKGTVVTVTLQPDDGKQVESLTVNGTPVQLGGATVYRLVLSENIVLAATFVDEPELYTVAVSASAGGSLSTTHQQAAHGTAVTVTATAESGYSLAALTCNGVDVTAEVQSNQYTFAAQAHTSLYALFAAEPLEETQQFTVSLYTNGSGTLTASASTAVQGTIVQLAATPDAGSRLVSLLINEKDVTANVENGIYSFILQADTSVVANFAQADAVVYGLITGDSLVYTGTETVKIGVEADYAKFLDVYVNGVRLTRDTDYIAQPGSIYVTLLQSYLATLSGGFYNIEIRLADGYAATALQVNLGADTQNTTESAAVTGATGSGASTGDTSNLPLLLCIAALALTAVVLLAIKAQRSKKARNKKGKNL